MATPACKCGARGASQTRRRLHDALVGLFHVRTRRLVETTRGRDPPGGCITQLPAGDGTPPVTLRPVPWCKFKHESQSGLHMPRTSRTAKSGRIAAKLCSWLALNGEIVRRILGSQHPLQLGVGCRTNSRWTRTNRHPRSQGRQFTAHDRSAGEGGNSYRSRGQLVKTSRN